MVVYDSESHQDHSYSLEQRRRIFVVVFETVDFFGVGVEGVIKDLGSLNLDLCSNAWKIGHCCLEGEEKNYFVHFAVASVVSAWVVGIGPVVVERVEIVAVDLVALEGIDL